MSTISPPSSPPGNADAKNTKKPFKIRAELLAPTRLAPKSQLLLHTRSLSVQVIAHQVLLLVLACTKCYATGRKDPPTIGVLGGGSVGVAVVMTILANGYQADRIALSTRQPDRIPRCEALKAPSALPMFQLVPRYYDNARLARESDILVLCMPPAQLKGVTIQIRHALAANTKTPPLVISTLCGVTQQSLTKSCGSEAVVRVQPDVEKIASLWHKQQQAEEELVGSLAQISAGLPVNVAELQRHRQPLPLELAAEAIAPQREGIRDLVKAFALFCRRPWNQIVGVEDVANVLFGNKSEMILTCLGQSVTDTSEEHNQEEEIGQTKDPLVMSSWPLEWEQDLAELQQQLVAHALQ